jgi:hypothetical protein
MKERLPWKNVDPPPLAFYLGANDLECALKQTPVTGPGTISLSQGRLSLPPNPTLVRILLEIGL